MSHQPIDRLIDYSEFWTDIMVGAVLYFSWKSAIVQYVSNAEVESGTIRWTEPDMNPADPIFNSDSLGEYTTIFLTSISSNCDFWLSFFLVDKKSILALSVKK